MGRPISTMLALIAVLVNTLGPPAQVAFAGGKQEEKTARAELVVLRMEVHGLHTRLDRVDVRMTALERRFQVLLKNQDLIDARIAVLAEGDKEMELLLQAFVADCKEIGDRLDVVNGQLCMTASDLEQLQCSLRQLSCALCKLAGNIRRAKIRAFIFGVLVGIGIGGAIGGGGGGGAALSVSPW